MKEHVVETDVLVIGGGMAGVFAAVKAREEGAVVTLVDKGYVGKSGARPRNSRASLSFHTPKDCRVGYPLTKTFARRGKYAWVSFTVTAIWSANWASNFNACPGSISGTYSKVEGRFEPLTGKRLAKAIGAATYPPV